MLGALAVVGMALCYAAGGLLVDGPPLRGTAAVVASGTSAVAALVVLPFGLAQAPCELRRAGRIGSVVFLGVVGHGVRLHPLLRDHRQAPARAYDPRHLPRPPVALAYGAMFLGERVGAAALVGLALILGGVALGTGLQRRRALVPAVEPT